MLATWAICIPDPDGRFEQLWITATDADGENGRMLRMARMRGSTDDSRVQVMADACWIHDGAPTTAIAAPHLAGQSVDVVADGLPIVGITLDENGEAELEEAAAQIIVGYAIPNELKLWRPEAGGDNGPALMKVGRINRCAVDLLNSDGLEIEVQGIVEPIETANWEQAPGTLPALYTGSVWMTTMGQWEREREVTIRRTLPQPATVRAVMTEMTMQQHGGMNQL